MFSYKKKIGVICMCLLYLTMGAFFSYAADANVLTPVASGTKVYKNDMAIIDASNTSQGYVMVKYIGKNDKIKVQISKSGSETYTYDLNANKSYEVFPFSEGSGSYVVKVFENISGNQYLQDMSQSISVNLENDTIPFLYPNQYVNFNSGSNVAAVAAGLASGAPDQLTTVVNIYNYVVDGFTYDREKATSVQSGYIPDIDATLASKTGICFDYASTMTAMLRSLNIPTKLVIGYTGDMYHAWISVYINNVGWIDNVIYFDGTDWQIMDPTFASSGGRTESTLAYISNAANYKAKYVY